MREKKESGILDIGLIPSDWIVPKVGYYYSFCSGDTLTSVDIDDDEGDFPVFGANGQRGYYSKYNTVGKHILIGRVGALCGNIHLIDGKNWVTEHALILSEKKECCDRYCGYLFETMNLGQYSKSSAQPVISVDTVSNLRFIIPSIIEQKAIADFLDSKCEEIDALVNDIVSEIEILEEYKRSLVFKSISHGLNNDVCIEVNSDVWKSIPEHWKLVDIKYLFEIVKRIAGKEGYDVIAITQQGLKFKDISTNEGQIASDYSGYQLVYPGDYAMNHMDLLTGWVDLSDKFGVTSPDYRVFRLRDTDNYDRKFYKYVMQCCYMCRIFYSLGQGVSTLGRWRLQTSAFNDFKVPVPPYEEQVAIGVFLDEAMSNIQQVLDRKKQQLDVLADYRRSLIYEYVTGKKEVPNG